MAGEIFIAIIHQRKSLVKEEELQSTVSVNYFAEQGVRSRKATSLNYFDLNGRSKFSATRNLITESLANQSQSPTPPWCEHVPRRCWLKLYVPSRHFSLAPLGT
jgi:hypothetical protein